MPAGDPAHERVATPDPPVTLVGLSLHRRLVEFVRTARFTVPLNPFSGTTVSVELPVFPILRATLAGLALSVKSGVAFT